MDVAIRGTLPGAQARQVTTIPEQVTGRAGLDCTPSLRHA